MPPFSFATSQGSLTKHAKRRPILVSQDMFPTTSQGRNCGADALRAGRLLLSVQLPVFGISGLSQASIRLEANPRPFHPDQPRHASHAGKVQLPCGADWIPLVSGLSCKAPAIHNFSRKKGSVKLASIDALGKRDHPQSRSSELCQSLRERHLVVLARCMEGVR